MARPALAPRDHLPGGAGSVRARLASVAAANGNLTSTTEGAAAVGSNPALNLTTSFTPDAVGNITATTTPLGYVSNATFDLDRRKLLDIDPNPGAGVRTATNTTYDANGRAIEVDKGTWSGAAFTSLETTTAAFDANGNKTQVSVLNGPFGSSPIVITQMSYDAFNRVLCTAERENAAAFGSLPVACTQSSGPISDHITQIAYDLAGQKHTETRGVGSAIQALYGTWTYGLDGELATILDGNSNLTTNLHDGFNRLAKIEYPMPTLGSGVSNPSDAEAFTSYDANSNLLSKTKRDGTTVIDFTYDVLNRRATKTFPATTSANVSYAYDLAGRPLNALFANVGGTPGVAWTYDAAGRAIEEALNLSSPRGSFKPDIVTLEAPTRAGFMRFSSLRGDASCAFEACAY